MEIMSNNYYNYMLLDPRKPTKWNYNNIQIDYESFYVGKESNSRVTDHYRDSCQDNQFTKRKIKILKNGGFTPHYIVYNKNSNENSVYKEEINSIQYIKNIFGNILTNMTDGGDAPSYQIWKR